MTGGARARKREAMQRLGDWFAGRGWRPLRFQKALWRRYLSGESGLLNTPTGSGKTLAAFGGPLLEALAAAPQVEPARAKRRRIPSRPLAVLWVTPLRALANDTVRALREPIEGLGLDLAIGMRTGDASARDRRLARAGKLDVLVTTPESLSLLLSYPDTTEHLSGLRCVIVDEWHELLDASGASELWVLGDVVHGAVNDTSWQESWRQWRVRHPQVSIAAVVGNHDRALANAGLGFELLGEEVDDGPFALRHHPGAHASRHVLAGHLHPAVRLPGMQGRRWPVFWLRGSHTVLPAFSEFTGSFVVEPAGSERVAICVEGEVVWLAAAGKPAGQAGLR